MRAFLRLLMQRQYLVPIVIFIFFTGMLLGIKMIRLDQEHGDSALYYQVTDNIASRGEPATNVSAAFKDFFDQKIPYMSGQQIAANALVPKEPDELYYFRLHANYIFYPIAILAKAFSARFVLLSLYILSFTGLVLFAYLILKSKGIPVTASALFCLLIVFHPAWSGGLEWQFYPERLFILAGFAFMFFVSRNDPGRVPLIVVGALCASISERTAMMAGAFVVLYTLLYWRSDLRDRPFRLGLGAVLAVYGFLVLKLVIVNPEYSHFLPTTLDGVLANFAIPAFQQHLGVFALVNLALFAIALFEWRAALIALVFMLPNIFGNMGGVEKVGWVTHYHDLYLPALVWAALSGFTVAYRLASARKLTPFFYGATCALVLFLGCVDPYGAAKSAIAPENLGNNFFVRFVDDSDTYFGPTGRTLAASYDQITQAVPESAVVSSPEASMSALYHERTLHFFPVDVDHADYAILSMMRGPDGAITYGGDIDYFIGKAEAQKVDSVVIARMKRDHYDFAHAVLIPQIGLAVVKRVQGSP